MFVKLFSRDLNLDPYPSHPVNTYTCRVIIAPRVCSTETKGHLDKGGNVPPNFFLNINIYIGTNFINFVL